MRSLGPAPLTLEERLSLDARIDDAFAPLRSRCAAIGPARVRGALRWTAPEPPRLRGLTLLGRLSELSIAAAVSAFLFAGSLAAVSAPAPRADVSRNAAAAGEWMLNGRNALQRPITSRFADYRMVAGEVAANAATARRPGDDVPAPPARATESVSAKP